MAAKLNPNPKGYNVYLFECLHCFDPYGRKDGYQKFDDATSSWEIYNSGNRKTATCKWNADKKLWEYKYAK